MADLSRRDFLKGAAVSAVGLTGFGALGMSVFADVPKHEQVEPENIKWDYEADVIVIGSGGAGLPAALKAMEEGASVIILECEYDVGGHAAVSGGNLHSGGGTEIQKKYDIEDNADMYYTDHTEGGPLATRYNDREYVRAVADNMRECYEFCLEKGLLIRDTAPTMRTPFKEGGTEPENTPRWTYADGATEGWLSYFGGTGGGMGVTRPLERTFRKQGGKIILNYHMDRLYREYQFSGKVLGVMASYTPTILPGEKEPLKSLMSDGNIDSTQPTLNIRAKKGVVLATGGSIGNLRFRTAIDPRLGPEFDGLSGMPFSDADASGELAAMAIGGSLGAISQFMQHGGHQIAFPRRVGNRYGYSSYKNDSPIWKKIRSYGIPVKLDDMIVVNMLGQRCGNEDKGNGGTYSYDSYEFFNTALSSVLAPDENGVLTRYGGPLWVICDQAAFDRNEWKDDQDTIDWEDGRGFKADTLEELAKKVINKYYEHVKMDPKILAETVKNYNSYVDGGEDKEWGRTTLTNKIEKGPFYALWAMPSLHDTYGGLKTNGDMNVIDIWGKPIPGLFAGGECTGGMRIHGFGRVMTSGYIAGKSAAAVK